MKNVKSYSEILSAYIQREVPGIFDTSHDILLD